MPNPLIQQAYSDWSAACLLLEDSLSRYLPYLATKTYSSKELEFYDSLSFRFIKSFETALYFFRSLENDLSSTPKDFLRDRLLFIEKTGIVEDTEQWFDARDLRNKIAHSYDPDELEKIFPLIQSSSLMILKSCKRAEIFLKKI